MLLGQHTFGGFKCQVSSRTQEIDLYTVTRDELTFSSPYSLTAKRNDYIDAIVSFFTVEFTKCHKPTGISTCKGGGGGGNCSTCYAILVLFFFFYLAPSSRYTHWKQTVFYIDDCLTIKQGEQLSGLISLAPNSKNKACACVFVCVCVWGLNRFVLVNTSEGPRLHHHVQLRWRTHASELETELPHAVNAKRCKHLCDHHTDMSAHSTHMNERGNNKKNWFNKKQ